MGEKLIDALACALSLESMRHIQFYHTSPVALSRLPFDPPFATA
jgi:hypothetical protein